METIRKNKGTTALLVTIGTIIATTIASVGGLAVVTLNSKDIRDLNNDIKAVVAEVAKTVSEMNVNSIEIKTVKQDIKEINTSLKDIVLSQQEMAVFLGSLRAIE